MDVVEYGVSTGNKFALCDFEGDDSDVFDPSELLSRFESRVKQDKKPNSLGKVKSDASLPKKHASIPPSKLTQKTIIPLTNADKSVRSSFNKENANGPFNGRPRSNAPAHGNIRNQRTQRNERPDLPPRFKQANLEEDRIQQNNAVMNGEEMLDVEREERLQNRPRFGFGGRGGLNGFGARVNRQNVGGFGKRQFERQSGSDKTGIKPIDKREGHGAHNWGAPADELVEQTLSIVTEDLNEPTQEKEMTPEGEIRNSNEMTEAPKEQEPVTLTLDEYKARQGARQAPQFNVRRPGEGEKKNPAWEKLKPLKNNSDAKNKALQPRNVIELDEDEEEDEEPDDRILPIHVKFIGGPVRRGGRGGFGRGGPRLNGQPKNENEKKTHDSVDVTFTMDDVSFPSLK